MDHSEKEKRIKEGILKICQQGQIPQNEIAQRASNELATKDEIMAVVAKMINHGELTITPYWEIKIPQNKNPA